MPEYVEMLRMVFVDLWASIIIFLPRLVIAVVVFILGVVIANALDKAIVRIVGLLKIDELLEKLEVKDVLIRSGLKVDIGHIFGWIVKWFIMIVALIASADALGWDQVTIFLSQVVAYIPNVLIAVIISLVGLLLGSFVKKIVQSALEAAKMHSATFISSIAKWSIIVFSFMAALVQLGIAQALIQTLFTGFVAMIALAGGLAFGLGGREHASRILNYIRRDLSSRE